MAGPVSSPELPAQQTQTALPRLVTDPVWSLKQWPVCIEIHGLEFTIPAMCAADWLHTLMSPSLEPDDVFPGLLPEDEYIEIERLLHQGKLDLTDTFEAAFEVISIVSGRPWWVALRLIQVARESWDAVGGDMAAVRADASLAAWLDTLFTLLVRSVEDDKRTMFLMKLELAPEGWGPDPEELEMSQDAFLAMAGE